MIEQLSSLDPVREWTAMLEANMPPRLIVNADDFGLTPGINRAIVELFDAGALRSATLMATGAAFEDAVRLARARPELGVGCHVVLTDGVPASPARTIPSLLDRSGRQLRPSLIGFLMALLLTEIDEEEIEREAIAQIRRIQAAGLTVTHIDAHKHTHIFPRVARPLLRAAQRTGVQAIRNPFEQPWSFLLSSGDPARTSQVRLLQRMQRRFLAQPALLSGAIRTTDGTIGISATGHLDEPTLANMLRALPQGTWELVCHPGYSDSDLDQIPTRLRASRDVERLALLRLLGRGAAVTATGVQAQLPSMELIHYGDLVRSNLSPSPQSAEQER